MCARSPHTGRNTLSTLERHGPLPKPGGKPPFPGRRRRKPPPFLPPPGGQTGKPNIQAPRRERGYILCVVNNSDRVTTRAAKKAAHGVCELTQWRDGVLRDTGQSAPPRAQNLWRILAENAPPVHSAHPLCVSTNIAGRVRQECAWGRETRYAPGPSTENLVFGGEAHQEWQGELRGGFHFWHLRPGIGGPASPHRKYAARLSRRSPRGSACRRDTRR